MKAPISCLLGLALLAAPAAQAQFTCATNTNGAITLLGYTGPGGNVAISNTVTDIGDNSFYQCANLTSVTIPNSVTNIGNNAFFMCTNLTTVMIPPASLKSG